MEVLFRKIYLCSKHMDEEQPDNKISAIHQTAAKWVYIDVQKKILLLFLLWDVVTLKLQTLQNRNIKWYVYLVLRLFKATPCICIHHLFSSSKYFSKSFVFVHSSFQNGSCSVRLDGKHLWTSVSKSGYRFSFVFRSGFWLDHYDTWKCFDLNDSTVCYCLYVWGHCTVERLISAPGFLPRLPLPYFTQSGWSNFCTTFHTYSKRCVWFGVSK